VQACTKTHRFEIKNAKIFRGGDTPSPDPTFIGASIFAPTALKLNVTPPEKILVTALIPTWVNLNKNFRRLWLRECRLHNSENNSSFREHTVGTLIKLLQFKRNNHAVREVCSTNFPLRVATLTISCVVFFFLFFFLSISYWYHSMANNVFKRLTLL